jgi:amiloride-sensitive sodium channel
LNVYFESDEFFGLHRSELFGLMDFIGNIGGLLGLFMGISILSFFEMIYYFTLRIACDKYRKKNQPESKTKSK